MTNNDAYIKSLEQTVDELQEYRTKTEGWFPTWQIIVAADLTELGTTFRRPNPHETVHWLKSNYVSYGYVRIVELNKFKTIYKASVMASLPESLHGLVPNETEFLTLEDAKEFVWSKIEKDKHLLCMYAYPIPITQKKK